MNINVLTMLGMMLTAVTFIIKRFLDKSGHIPNAVYIIAYVIAIVLLAAGLIKGCKDRL